MKKIRILLASTMVVALILALTACGGSKKIKLGNGTTGEVKPNGNVSVTGKNGESINVGENLKWPKEHMGSLPEIKGKITGVLRDEKTQNCSIVFSEMTLEDAKEYIENMKKLGYSNGMTFSDSETLMISGTAKDNSEASFTYNSSTKEGTVSYRVKGENSNNQTNTNIDMSGNAKWPEGVIKGVPELKGKITSVINDGSNTVTVSLENVNKSDFEAYIEQLKKNGFTDEINEAKSESYIEFNAYNSDRELVHAYLTIMEGNNSAVIEMEKASN